MHILFVFRWGTKAFVIYVCESNVPYSVQTLIEMIRMSNWTESSMFFIWSMISVRQNQQKRRIQYKIRIHQISKNIPIISRSSWFLAEVKSFHHQCYLHNHDEYLLPSPEPTNQPDRHVRYVPMYVQQSWMFVSLGGPKWMTNGIPFFDFPNRIIHWQMNQPTPDWIK